jgi:hypothetical protein
MSKKTIGIYGDSYCSVMNPEYGENFWVTHLKEFYDVTNYGHPGNSIYKCYRDYMENYQKHDINVMVIPTIDRFYSSYLENSDIAKTLSNKNWYTHYSNVLLHENTYKNKFNRPDSDFNLKIFDSVRLYFEFWKDDDYVNTVNLLLVEKIKTFKNLITIDVTSSDSDHIGLRDVSIWELNNMAGYHEQYIFKGTPPGYEDIENKKFVKDKRICHLTEENNMVLTTIVQDAIKNNVKEIKLKIQDFVAPTKNVNYYIGWENY